MPKRFITTEITITWERPKKKRALSEILFGLAKRQFGGARKAFFWKLGMRAYALEQKLLRATAKQRAEIKHIHTPSNEF